MARKQIEEMKSDLAAGTVKGVPEPEPPPEQAPEATAPDATERSNMVGAYAGLIAMVSAVMCARAEVPQLDKDELIGIASAVVDLAGAYGIKPGDPRLVAWFGLAGAIGPVVMVRGEIYLTKKRERMTRARQEAEARLRVSVPTVPVADDVPAPTAAQSYEGA